MEQPIFSFQKMVGLTMKHPCPACGSGTVEVLSEWKQNHQDGDMRATGIYRCLADSCDSYFVPSMPEVHG